MTKQRKFTVRDQKVDKALENYIMETYGSKHTVYSELVETGLILLLNYLKVPGYNQYEIIEKDSGGLGGCTHKNSLKPREKRLMQEFYKEFFGRGLSGGNIRDDDLTAFLKTTLLIKDPRSVASNKEFFQDLGWITPVKRVNEYAQREEVVAWKEHIDIEGFEDIVGPWLFTIDDAMERLRSRNDKL